VTNGATSFKINTIAVTGTSYTVTPTTNTTYTLTATNSSGSSTATVTVTVTGKPTITGFKASPTTINSGSSTTLSWSDSNATKLTLVTTSSDGSTETTDVTGTTSLSVSPTYTPSLTTEYGTYTYTLTATNAAGAGASASVTVKVVLAPVITSFTANPSTIFSGQSSYLLFSSNINTAEIGTWSITASDGSIVEGDYRITPTSTTTYTLTVTNLTGTSATAQVTVKVLPAINYFTSSSSSVGIDSNSVTLSWKVADATSLSIDSGVGTVTGATGSTTVSPTATTTYTLTATNSDGTTTSLPLTITKTAALDDITSFMVTNSTGSATSTASTSAGVPVYLTAVFNSGDSAALINDKNSNSVIVTSGTPISVSPSVSTTYTLTVTNPSYPTLTQTRTLRVIVGEITAFSGVGILESLSPTTTFSDGSATSAQFEVPWSLTTDSAGNVYFTDYTACVVEELDHATGNATRVAGQANNCASQTYIDGNALTVAEFYGLYGIAVASSGDIYVGENSNDDIRKISGGVVSTPAGGYYYGIQGKDVDGTGSTAIFAGMEDVALDSLGELIVTDAVTMRVMVMNSDGTGTVTTLAGTASDSGLMDGTGKTGSGADTAIFKTVRGIAIDTSTDSSTDTIYMTDDNTIRIMTPDKSKAKMTAACQALATPGAACWTWTVTSWINPTDTAAHVDGSPSTAQVNSAGSIARASDGTLYVQEGGSWVYVNGVNDYNIGSHIRRITPAGVMDTIAGDGSKCVEYTMCTLPNSGNSATNPLPGVVRPGRIAVDPASNRLFFTVGDVTSIYTMPR
jgi:hypothetical protein